MAEEKFVKVSGTGSFLPGDPIPFEQIEDYLGHITEAPKKVMKWIERSRPLLKEMLNIDYCHYAIDPVTKERTEDHVTMSVKAAHKAFEAAGLTPEDIDLITYGSPYMQQIPPTSTRIQEALGIEKCAEMAVHSNCSSAYKALMIAHDMLRNGRYKRALVLSTCMNSSFLRADYYNQNIIQAEDVFIRWFLCDGSGAIILEATDTKSDGLFLDHTYNESIGGKKPSAMHNGFPAYFVNLPEAYDKGYHHVLQMFKLELREHMLDPNGITIFTNGIGRMLKMYDIDIAKLRFFQINMPAKHIVDIILTECEQVLGISRNLLYTKVSKMGYPGPPAALICLDKINREETLEKGDIILSFVTEVSKFIQCGFSVSRW